MVPRVMGGNERDRYWEGESEGWKKKMEGRSVCSADLYLLAFGMTCVVAEAEKMIM